MEINRCYGCMRELPAADIVCPHCGYDNANDPGKQPEHMLACGTKLNNKYFVGRALGQGGFGVTYIGWDEALETRICIKEYFPEGAAMRSSTDSCAVTWLSSGKSDKLKNGRDSFAREARKAARLRDLRSVVKVWDVFQSNDTAYIVMDYIEGMTLKSYLIKNGTPLTEQECFRLLSPVMVDLEEVHRRDIIHRDISPDNLMMRTDGTLVLLDLGAAKDLSRSNGQSSFLVAKKGFSPMEQYTQNGLIGAWTDVYAMCATMVYCVSGRLIPEPLERYSGSKVDLSAFSPSFAEVLEQGLILEPDKRIQSMGELRRMLERVCNPVPEPEAEPTPEPRSEAEPTPEPAEISEPDFATQPVERVKPKQDRKSGAKWIIPSSVAALLAAGGLLFALKAAPEKSEIANTRQTADISQINTRTIEKATEMAEEKISQTIDEVQFTNMTPTPSSTPEPTPSSTPEPTPSPTPEPTPSPTPEPTPSPTPEPTPSPTPEPTPTATPEPTPQPLARIIAQPTSQEVAEGEKCTLVIMANSPDNGELSYQWFSGTSDQLSDASPVNGATSPTLTISPKEGRYYYWAAVWNSKGGKYSEAVYSDFAEIVIKPPLKQELNPAEELTNPDAEEMRSLGEQARAAMALYSRGDQASRERSLALWDGIAARNTIAAGRVHIVGLKTDGTVAAVQEQFQYDSQGQNAVEDWNNIIALAAGNYNTVGLKADGSVAAVGNNDYGQCDVSDWQDIVAISAGAAHTVGLRADGTVIAVGDNRQGQCDVSTWKEIAAIAAGWNFTVGLRADGTVVAAGFNGNGCCDVDSWRDIVAIAASGSNTMGLKADGSVVVAGQNGEGQCDWSDLHDVVAIAAGGNDGDYTNSIQGCCHTVCLREDGTVVARGSNKFKQCNVSDWADVVAVAAAHASTIGLKADGTVVAVGSLNKQKEAFDWQNIKLPSRKMTARKADPAQEVASVSAAAELTEAEAETLYQKGRGYEEQRDYTNAFSSYESAALAGNMDAMARIGMMYYYGSGVSRNADTAMYWLGLAADGGNAEAAHQLARAAYSAGDYDRAREMYLTAAERGDVSSMFELGLMYYNGVGVDRDYAEARTWFTKAAEGGNGEAYYYIGNMYYYGQGVSTDNTRAALYWQKAEEMLGQTLILPTA